MIENNKNYSMIYFSLTKDFKTLIQIKMNLIQVHLIVNLLTITQRERKVKTEQLIPQENGSLIRISKERFNFQMKSKEVTHKQE